MKYVKLGALLAVLFAILASTAQAATVPAPTTDKVVVIVVENHSLAQMQKGAPKIWALGQRYGYASSFTACRHPSLPNYVCMVAGTTAGITDDKFHKVTAPNLLSGAIRAGRTAKVVADGMGTDRCRQTNGGNKYVWRHNPFVPFTYDRALCEKYDFDLKYLAGDVAASKLANVEFLIPNQCNNAHDCSLGTADKWVSSKVALLQSGPDWAAGRLTIVVTADEDNGTKDNRILTVVIHPSQSHNVVSTPLTLYGLSRTLSRFGCTPALASAKTATDVATAFDLPMKGCV